MKTKDITPYNDKGEKHGSWEYYWSNGQLSYKGNFVAGKEHGSWEVYWNNGQLKEKTYYI